MEEVDETAREFSEVLDWRPCNMGWRPDPEKDGDPVVIQDMTASPYQIFMKFKLAECSFTLYNTLIQNYESEHHIPHHTFDYEKNFSFSTSYGKLHLSEFAHILDMTILNPRYDDLFRRVITHVPQFVSDIHSHTPDIDLGVRILDVDKPISAAELIGKMETLQKISIVHHPKYEIRVSFTW